MRPAILDLLTSISSSLSAYLFPYMAGLSPIMIEALANSKQTSVHLRDKALLLCAGLGSNLEGHLHLVNPLLCDILRSHASADSSKALVCDTFANLAFNTSDSRFFASQNIACLVPILRHPNQTCCDAAAKALVNILQKAGSVGESFHHVVKAVGISYRSSVRAYF